MSKNRKKDDQDWMQEARNIVDDAFNQPDIYDQATAIVNAHLENHNYQMPARKKDTVQQEVNGVVYYLHRVTSIVNWEKQTSYFFSTEFRPNMACTEIPDGYEIKVNNIGKPELVKINR